MSVAQISLSKQGRPSGVTARAMEEQLFRSRLLAVFLPTVPLARIRAFGSANATDYLRHADTKLSREGAPATKSSGDLRNAGAHLRRFSSVAFITASVVWILAGCAAVPSGSSGEERPATPTTAPRASMAPTKTTAPRTTTPESAATQKPKATTRPPTVGNKCHPSYRPCLPIVADLDCPDVRALGKAPVEVIGRDEYRLDRDHDGKGCE
jgi:hypothetical protein